jgi:hypothetical protein
MKVEGTEALEVELERIVAEFGQWVKGLVQRPMALGTPADLATLEEDVAVRTKQVERQVVGTLVQAAVAQQQEGQRRCPQCRQPRRHKGLRPQQILLASGPVTVTGIYWHCPVCGTCGPSAEKFLPESLSLRMRQLICLLGASLASFDKAETVARRLLLVPLDDDRIRRTCLQVGWELTRQETAVPPAAEPGGLLVGSCDGTMVHTRQESWREIKGFRFEHPGGRWGGAFLEKAPAFTPRLRTAARQLAAEQAGTCLFVSDAAEWILRAVAKELPGWTHILDFYHATEHVQACGEVLYGIESRKAACWTRYWSRRLKQYGAAYVGDHLADLSGSYGFHPAQRPKQKAVLTLVRYLRKHQHQMDYPAYLARGWPIGSGPMESFCKQLGLRLKGPGMRWNLTSVSPMAQLVTHWCLAPESPALFGSSSKAA